MAGKFYQRKTVNKGGGIKQTITRSSNGSIRVTNSVGSKQHRIAFSTKDGKSRTTESRNYSGWISRKVSTNGGGRKKKIWSPISFTRKRKSKLSIQWWWILVIVVAIIAM